MVLFIKDNTPATRADLELFFEDEQADRRTWQSFAKSEKGHGRLERRHITTSPDRNRLSVPGLGRSGTGLSSASRTHQPRQAQSRGGLWLDESVAKAVLSPTSLSVDSCALGCGKSAPLAPRRHGWREDECGVRLPPVAQMLAVLNTVVLSLMDRHQVTNVARQIRRFVSHPDEALAWVINF